MEDQHENKFEDQNHLTGMGQLRPVFNTIHGSSESFLMKLYIRFTLSNENTDGYFPVLCGYDEKI